METKHTKGEWEVKQEPFNLLVIHEQNGTPMSICQTSSRFKTNEEQLANARLIAAAPELLEAAMLALEAIEMYVIDDYIMKDTIAEISLRQAIQKAKGE